MDKKSLEMWSASRCAIRIGIWGPVYLNKPWAQKTEQNKKKYLFLFLAPWHHNETVPGLHNELRPSWDSIATSYAGPPAPMPLISDIEEPEYLKLLNKNKYRIFIISNQSGIARGLFRKKCICYRLSNSIRFIFWKTLYFFTAHEYLITILSLSMQILCLEILIINRFYSIL